MIGRTLDHYRILAKLGEGGMGAVYLAEDTELERNVALKLLPTALAHDPDRLARLRREARSAARINHPNVVTLHAVAEDEGIHFIVMEHVEGEELDRLIPPQGMALDRFFEVAVAIAEALDAAHEKDIVHRDLKPANVVVTQSGLTKVLDFGLAKVQDDQAETLEVGASELMTRPGAVLGTAPYMSPEQASGQPVDHRSDVFSFGIVLYEMLTGARPFQGATFVETVSSILKDQEPPLAERRGDLPGGLEAVIHRCLAKDPAERYQSARELSDELARLHRESGSLAHPGPSRASASLPAPPSEPGQAEPPERKDGARKWALLAAAALVAVLAVVGYSTIDRTVDAGEEVESLSFGAAGTRLAVLPFSNLRSDPETDFLGYALADQVIGELAYARNLTVRPSTSVRKYRHGEHTLEEIRDELAVDYVLAGNYLQQGELMRLTVELIDLAASSTVWREPIEVSYADVFAMQDLVSQRLLARLEISFSEEERERMNADVSRNPLAYEFYLRSLSHEVDAEGNRLATNLLRQSTALDPGFAPAWAELGRRSQLMAYWELGGEEVANQAKELLLEALSINPELLSARAHLTMLYTDFGETDRAIETAQRLLEINPNSAEGIFAYGYVLRYAGMLEESLAAMRTARELDPTNRTFRSAAWTLIQAGEYEEALEAFRLGSADLVAAWEGEIAIRRGDLKLARAKLAEAIALDPEGITGLWATGLLAALDGAPARGLEAARKWQDAQLPDGEGWFYLAGLYCLNGEIGTCIQLLGEAVDRGAFEYEHYSKCRFLDPARGDPAFEAVLERARLRHEAFRKKYFG